MAGELVVTLQWSEGGIARQETYGPWTPADDDSHLEQITAFMKAWRKATGCDPAAATMAVIVDPQQLPVPLPVGYVEALAREWTPEQVERFRERWNAAHP